MIAESYKELLRGLAWNSWLHRQESQRIMSRLEQGLNEEEAKDLYLKTKSKIESRLGYWQSYQ